MSTWRRRINRDRSILRSRTKKKKEVLKTNRGKEMMKMIIKPITSMERTANMMILILKKSSMLSILIRKTKKADIIKIRDITIKSMNEYALILLWMC